MAKFLWTALWNANSLTQHKDKIQLFLAVIQELHNNVIQATNFAFNKFYCKPLRYKKREAIANRRNHISENVATLKSSVVNEALCRIKGQKYPACC